MRDHTAEGKVWFGELASMFGSNTTEKSVVLAEHVGKVDIRDFGGGKPRSGGSPTHDQRGKGSKSGDCPTSSIPSQPCSTAPWRTRE